MRDFQDRQYYITGQITFSVFSDDCVFKDPTTKVKGPDTYSNAVASLFDPDVSRADLISAEVLDPHTLRFRDISAADAFISALVPSFGAPPAPPVTLLQLSRVTVY
ncbi:hypothetical protein WJX81_003957 [Elliptochloris bilobata]|uniref:Uncharacterized protein n=1 Tax=Elliptochloris bilobata TaxID=381761 RepID=A0AAW1QJW5_9CHLO